MVLYLCRVYVGHLDRNFRIEVYHSIPKATRAMANIALILRIYFITELYLDPSVNAVRPFNRP